MGYTVKSIKTINGVDGQGFSAKIYFDGKLIGQVFDYADGAPVVLDMQAVHRKALMDYVDTLPNITCAFKDPATGKPAVVKPTADAFIVTMVQRQRTLQRVKRFIKKGNTLVVIDHGELYKIEYTIMRESTVSYYRKAHPSHIILNGLSDDDLLSTLASFGL